MPQARWEDEGARGLSEHHAVMPVAVPTASQSNPKLLTRLRSKLRLGHYSRRTEQAYASWVARFVRHHGLKHPADLGEADVVAFLRYLAEDRHVAQATQAQALSALLFLYQPSSSVRSGSRVGFPAPGGRRGYRSC